jgi:type II pantothenate kinase
MVLGIDFGISTTDVALVEGGKLQNAFHIDSKSLKELREALVVRGIDVRAIDELAVTGGRASLHRLFGKSVARVSELSAIGFGGAFIAGLRSALVVSMGTGTCIVSLRRGRVGHVGGTALGGGTIIGLSRRLLGEANVQKLKRLASTGSSKGTDLSVREAIGGGIGIVPANATASFFAGGGRQGKSDTAFALQNMVGENNAVIAALAAKSSGHKDIVFIGKTTLFPVVRRAIKRVLGYYGFSPRFPKMGAYATAIGAAAVRGNCVE